MPLDPRPGQGPFRAAKPKNILAVSLGERLAQVVTRWSGSTSAFSVGAVFVLVWVAAGPLFRWSNTWQLIMNTASSIVTFLMVFLIQRSQVRRSDARLQGSGRRQR
jgi:low affinity Fe/Cu permease